MRLLRVSTGTAISFHRAAALASGGEGCIYPVPQEPVASGQDLPSAQHWNPNGTILASAGQDQRVILWDTVTWTQWRTVSEPRRRIRGIAWSPDGRKLAINTAEALTIWDVSR